MDCGCCYKTNIYYRGLVSIANKGELRTDLHRYHYYCPNFKELFSIWNGKGDFSEIFKCKTKTGIMPVNPRSHHTIRWTGSMFAEEPNDYYYEWKYAQDAYRKAPKRKQKAPETPKSKRGPKNIIYCP